MILIEEQHMQDHQRNADRNAAVRNVERWKVIPERIRIDEVDNISKPVTIDKIAQSTAPDQTDRDGNDSILQGSLHIKIDQNSDRQYVHNREKQ